MKFEKNLRFTLYNIIGEVSLMSYRILLVDDEEKVIIMLQNFLQRKGYQVNCALY